MTMSSYNVILFLTWAVYVLMGGQLLAPHTRAKWTLGSGSDKAIFNLGGFGVSGGGGGGGG